MIALRFRAMLSTLPILPTTTARKPPGRSDAVAEGPGDLLALLLREQGELTAVERFSQDHGRVSMPRTRRYASLLPTAPPGPGQQYGFKVDLDLCSGCKACVTACHSLNGLDDGEAWRDVGLLTGGTAERPVVQHVTTACHHCLDPACLKACPVDACEKDPTTGIVRHLDDQCFGCQYCTLACPYDVPKFHKAKGIVRKCDLCSDRLAAGEPPACAQACPHSAIRVAVIDRAKVIEDCEANAFLPGAPNPDYTLPTTTSKSRRAFPRNLLPADYYSVKPEHAHWPLVVMLVLTQLSVGAFVAELFSQAGRHDGTAAALHPVFSLAFGLLALGASTLHLGRPHLAFRAMLGLRHSWLSREAAAFGGFAPLAGLYAGLSWWRPDFYAAPPWLASALALSVVASGAAGVGCGVMVYHVVRRAFWHAARGGVKFFGTAAILGAAAAVLTGHLSAAVTGGSVAAANLASRPLVLFLAAAVAAKLLFEAGHFVHLRDTQFTSLRRSAVLMTGVLAKPTLARFALGGVGLIAALSLLTADAATSPVLLLAGSSVAFGALLGGELAERYLFFTAVVRQKMPGGLTV